MEKIHNFCVCVCVCGGGGGGGDKPLHRYMYDTRLALINLCCIKILCLGAARLGREMQ